MEDGNLDANRAVKGQQFLEKCGLLGTYECKVQIDLLKNLVENGLPTGNIYEYAALIVLRYEKKLRTQVRKVIGKTSPSVDNLSFDHEARTEPTEFSSPVPGPTSKIMMKEEDKAVNIKKKPEESKVKQLEEKKLRPEENKVKHLEEKKSKPEENKVKQLEESKIKQLEEKKSKPEESKVKQLEEKKSKPEENKVKQLEENKTKPEDLKEEDKKASKKPTKATEEKKQLKLHTALRNTKQPNKRDYLNGEGYYLSIFLDVREFPKDQKEAGIQQINEV